MGSITSWYVSTHFDRNDIRVKLRSAAVIEYKILELPQIRRIWVQIRICSHRIQNSEIRIRLQDFSTKCLNSEKHFLFFDKSCIYVMYMYGDSVNLITVETEMSMLSFNTVRFLTEQNHSSEEHAETLARVPLYRLEWVHYIMHDVGGSAVVQQT